MRVLTDDILAALDCLLAVPPQARTTLLAELLHRAEVAARFRREQGRVHPVYGGGSLMAAAASLREGARVRWCWEDPEVRDQAIRLLAALTPDCAAQPRAHSRHFGEAGSSSSRASSMASPHSRQ